MKQLVLSEVKAGISVAQASEKYGIDSHMTVYRWCKKYGIETTKREIVDVPLELSLNKENKEVMSKKNEKKDNHKAGKSEEDKLKLLEYELALYKKLVDIPTGINPLFVSDLTFIDTVEGFVYLFLITYQRGQLNKGKIYFVK